MLPTIPVNTTAFRVVIIFLAFILLVILAGYLRLEEPDLKKSEIIKIINSGLVIIGLMYSILTFESNQIKNRHDIRVRKCSATYNVIREWHMSPMMDYSKICKEFELKNEYQLLKNDIESFMQEFDNSINSEYRKSLICVLNYFESIAVAISEDLLDELFTKKYFRLIFLEFYDDYFFFIHERRKIKNDNEIWQEYTRLAYKWKTS
ncbi:protein of unknown function [Chitinophaga sp. CF118]|uniref:DUF4760 domain-containing protein n=1 Tax=Chitinophaga sp. CF118 TaxID=1884367 RepID=UPI0008E809D5|nr:DUF4760 domain-containing protein [Chitinophaga sp. CF118]SFD76433.1 protein of unknown function [Chitinophaga sp. CF118]